MRLTIESKSNDRLQANVFLLEFHISPIRIQFQKHCSKKKTFAFPSFSGRSHIINVEQRCRPHLKLRIEFYEC